MRARLWLRIASVFVFLFFLGHTAAVLIPQPSSGPAEDAAVGAMKAFHFDAMGAERTLWNFWEGFNYLLSVHVLTLAGRGVAARAGRADTPGRAPPPRRRARPRPPRDGRPLRDLLLHPSDRLLDHRRIRIFRGLAVPRPGAAAA